MNRTNGRVVEISRVIQASYVRARELKIDTSRFHAEHVPQSETCYEDIVWRFCRNDGGDGGYNNYTLRGSTYSTQFDDLRKIFTKAEMILFLEFEPYFETFRTYLSWDNALAESFKKLADSAIGN